MFDLDKAIEEWRQQMLMAGIKTPVPLEELESHLRDDMERGIRAGLGAQQAFETAVHRLGQAKRLQAEFSKVPAQKETRERRLKLLCLACVGVIYSFVGWMAVGMPKPWCPMDPTEKWLGLTAVVLSVLGMFSGQLFHRFLPLIHDQRIRRRVQFAVAIPLFVWLCAFFYLVLPRVEWTPAQLIVSILWACSPLAVLGGLICGLDEAAWQRSSVASSSQEAKA